MVKNNNKKFHKIKFVRFTSGGFFRLKMQTANQSVISQWLHVSFCTVYVHYSVILSVQCACLTTNSPSSSGAFGPLAYPSIPAHKANGGIDPEQHVPVYHRANTERPSFKLTFTHTAYSESTSSPAVGKSCSSLKKPMQAIFQFFIQLVEASTAWIRSRVSVTQ